MEKEAEARRQMRIQKVDEVVGNTPGGITPLARIAALLGLPVDLVQEDGTKVNIPAEDGNLNIQDLNARTRT